MDWYTLVAQGGQDGGQPPPLLASPLFMLVIMVVIMYFFMIAPMRKQRREQMNMLATLKRNDKVVTSGGLLGIVVSIKEGEDEVTLKVDDSSNTRVRVLKSSIVRVTASDDKEKDGESKGN